MDSPTAALKADRSGGRRLRVRRRRRLQALPAQAGVVLGMVALLIAWYGVVEVPPAAPVLFEPDGSEPGDPAQFRQLSEELRQLSEGAPPPPAAGGCQGFPSRVTRGRGNFIARPGWDETTQTAWADRDEDRWKAILLAISVMLYMFLGLAIVCDEYFEAALEAICEAQNLKDDVAGATWMAAGGSAPELSTSVVGVFISQSDVGLGTIIGSAVFNVLFVIACCAFVAPNLHLHWYPLARDASYYCFSIFVLITFIYDKRVDWWEALVLLLLYALCAARRIQPTTVADQKTPHPSPLAAHHSPPASRPRYVTIMYKNDKLEAFVQRRIAAAKKPRSPMQAMIIDMFKRHWMNGIVYSVIVINVVVVLLMLTPSIEIDLVLMQNLEIINYTCSVIFILEMLVKFYAYGFFGYWREPLNCFDGVLVFLIFIETFLSFAPLVGGLNDDADGAFVGGFRGLRTFRAIRVLRTLRVLRIYRAFHKHHKDATTQVVPSDYASMVNGAAAAGRPAAPVARSSMPELGSKSKREDSTSSVGAGAAPKSPAKKVPAPMPPRASTVGQEPEDEEEEEDDDDDEPAQIFALPDGGWAKFFFILGWPLRLCFRLSIPDCRHEMLQRCWFGTFMMSVIWIGWLAYVMVWMVTEVRDRPRNISPIQSPRATLSHSHRTSPLRSLGWRSTRPTRSWGSRSSRRARRSPTASRRSPSRAAATATWRCRRRSARTSSTS